MNLQEIKAAVEAGKTVHWASTNYTVIKDSADQWLIKCKSNSSVIGLTWQDGETLNGKPGEFFIGGKGELTPSEKPGTVTADQIIKSLEAAGVDVSNVSAGHSGGGCATMYGGDPIALSVRHDWNSGKIVPDSGETAERWVLGPGSMTRGYGAQFFFDELYVGPALADRAVTRVENMAELVAWVIRLERVGKVAHRYYEICDVNGTLPDVYEAGSDGFIAHEVKGELVETASEMMDETELELGFMPDLDICLQAVLGLIGGY